MAAVGEIENKMLSQFQSRVHLHLQGYRVPPDTLNFLLDLDMIVPGKTQAMHNSGGKNRKNPSENTIFFKTIRKMCALRNE